MEPPNFEVGRVNQMKSPTAIMSQKLIKVPRHTKSPVASQNLSFTDQRINESYHNAMHRSDDLKFADKAKPGPKRMIRSPNDNNIRIRPGLKSPQKPAPQSFGL